MQKIKKIINSIRFIIRKSLFGQYLNCIDFSSTKKNIQILRKHLESTKKVKQIYKTQKGINLELGMGSLKQEGWIKIDPSMGNSDLKIDLLKPFPFPDLSVVHIYSSNFIQHFSYPDPLKYLLKECFRILKLNGTFSAVVPNIGKALKSYAKGEIEFYNMKFWESPRKNWCKSPMDDLDWLIYSGGKQKTIFDEINIIDRFEDVGFSEVDINFNDTTIDSVKKRNRYIFVTAKKTSEKPFALKQKDMCLNNDIREYDKLWGNLFLTQRYAEPDRISLWRHIVNRCPKRYSKLLDIGCGGGHILSILNRQIQSPEKLWGVDNSKKAVEQSKNRVPGANILCQDATKMNFSDDIFDVIICCEVLEHLKKPHLALSEAYRVLSPGGIIIITIPDGDMDEYPGHENFWNEKEFREFSNGFPISNFERIHPTNNLLFVIKK